METVKPVVSEVTINAPASKVWDALTKPDEIKQWFMAADDFKPQVGSKFHMLGRKDDEEFHIECKITELEKNKKLAYTWTYDEYPLDTLVTIELTGDKDTTKVKLVHTGWKATENEKVSRENHQQGWNHFVAVKLKNYVEGL
jgi:uncharacterized protein YndB with AHSA1/START domain